MKKLICFLLAIVMTVSLAIPAFAEESEEPQYGTIKVEYSDARGTIENLDVMVLNGYVYAHMASFCERLGYRWDQKDGLVTIDVVAGIWYDEAPALALHFRPGDTTVSYNPLCGIEIEYDAPTPFIENDRGIWVPLQYTLTLLGGSRNIAGDILVIQIPTANVLSVAAMIMNSGGVLSFDWVDDFGYSETATNVTDGAARVVTLFEGLLSFDGSAWTSFVDWNAFDKKFGKTLAALMCTYSSDELKDSIEEVEVMLDVFADDGALGSMLRTQEALIDSDVNAWEKICEEKLAQLKSGCGTLPQYNMAYQQYERATKKQDLFSAVGGNDFVYIQDGLAEAANALEWATRIGYGVTYLTEFQKRDDFQSTVLKDYFSTRRKTEELDDATAQAIENYASSGLIEYSLRRFLEEHALEIFVDESGLDALMGVPANLLLLAWDIMSENIPFYSDGLKSVEAREISNYAQQVQTDAFLNLNDLLDSMRASPDSITYADAFLLAEYCYVYLKSCYIARSSAIDSLKGISEEAQKKLQSKIDVETDINRYIADYLAILGQADLDNSCFILGFLPKNNRELLEMYSDADLAAIFHPQSAGGHQKQLTRINKYDESGSLIHYTEYFYYDSSLLRTTVSQDLEQEQCVFELHTTFTYDGSNRLLSRVTENPEYPGEGSGVEYTYDNQGRIISSMAWEGGGAETTYEYDTQNRMIRTKEVCEGGTCETEYHYDDNGRLIQDIRISGEEWSDETWSETTVYSYDTEGRLSRKELKGAYQALTEIYDYSYLPFVIVDHSYNGGSHSFYVMLPDGSLEMFGVTTFKDPQFYTDEDGYLAKVIDNTDYWGTCVYEFYYQNEIAKPVNGPFQIETGEAVESHTSDEAEALLYEYLVQIYGNEGLSVNRVNSKLYSGTTLMMNIAGYVTEWYTVDLDTGIVTIAETGRYICDLW